MPSFPFSWFPWAVHANNYTRSCKHSQISTFNRRYAINGQFVNDVHTTFWLGIKDEARVTEAIKKHARRTDSNKCGSFYARLDVHQLKNIADRRGYLLLLPPSSSVV